MNQPPSLLNMLLMLLSRHTRRREFITFLGGAAVWPLAARAQLADQVWRIGVLSNIGESDPEAQSMATALHEGLRELGWVNGRNLQVDHRWAAGNPERAATFAKELVALKPEVIVAHTTPSVIALRKQTGIIPIVFVQISDPIGAGFITNLARPGGNITGFTNFESAMVGKWVEMLEEMAPSISRVAFLFNPQTAPYVARFYRHHWRLLRGRSGCSRWQAPFTTPVKSKARSMRSGARAAV